MKRAPDASAIRHAVGDDTDQAIAAMLVSLWQQMSPAKRLARALSVTAAVDELARAGARARSRAPQQWMTYAEARLGREIAHTVYASSEPGPLDADVMSHVDVVLAVVRALGHCEIEYVVGGSLASSVSGEPRATVDADLMVDLAIGQIACLVQALGADFYAEEAALERAVRARSHANIVHRPTATKVDLFIMGATTIEPEQMRRRRRVTLDRTAAEIYVYSPEDILLQKLRWFRLGGEVSDRQWRDISGIVAVQEERLDRRYLERAAAEIGVSDLLERALAKGPGRLPD